MGNIQYAIILALLSSSGVLLMGCTSGGTDDGTDGQFQEHFQNRSGGGPRNGSFGGNGFPGGSRNGSFGNLTEEQQRQMADERQKAAIDACSGKKEGDSCTIQTPRGEQKSTCKIESGILACALAIPTGARGQPIAASQAPDSELQVISPGELAKHQAENDCWVAFQGRAYDLTSWLPKHPGSAGAISPYCGTMGFEAAFGQQHGNSKTSLLMMEGKLMGKIAQ